MAYIRVGDFSLMWMPRLGRSGSIGANFSEPDLTASLWQHFHRSGVTRPADMNEAGAD